MTQEPSIYKPLLHWDGHLSAAFFHKEDAMIFDLSSVASDEILGTVSQENGQSVPATIYAACHLLCRPLLCRVDKGESAGKDFGGRRTLCAIE